jgi:hypothetical protein
MMMHNSVRISEFWLNSAEKKNSKQNFDQDVEVDVHNEAQFC